MKKILMSLSMIGMVAVVVAGATGAFFSDTETSTGNTFTAGAIDLTVDSQQHYGNNECVGSVWTGPDAYPTGACYGTWTATNLGAQHQFFDFSDIKPGDSGENTVSLHVDNDAWLRLVVNTVTDADNSCTEPESSVDPDGVTCGTNGELRDNLLFSIWLDQGATAGFQCAGVAECVTDPTEGDNILNSGEPTIVSSGTIDAAGEVWDLSAYTPFPYLLGGQTAYFGIDWSLPGTVGNEAQTDSMSATMEFRVEQHRNNPTPTL